ncbi:hypothetical protein AMECASPLE_022667 [Ameca splendens]|uniref:Uncharacterized protein n=1 Tax=Ameca splendens TaxID=208324 RepID=A0ABV0Y3W7_9TELE
MEARYLCHLSLILAWICLLSFPSVCTGMNALEIKLKSTVFVAFSGEDLSIDVSIHKPTNQTPADLLCFDPSQKEINRTSIDPIEGEQPLQINLKTLSSSGMYRFTYNTAEVKWFLRVTGENKCHFLGLSYLILKFLQDQLSEGFCHQYEDVYEEV